MYPEYPYILIYDITTPATTSDFQVSLSLPRVAQIASDYSNIRFSDGANKLPYWVQTDFTSTSATVWVKLKNPNTTMLYCYYGAANVPSESNGNNTFLFFDDFDGSSLDTNKWTHKRLSGTAFIAATVVNGYADISAGTATSSAIVSKTSFPMPFIANCRYKTPNSPTGYGEASLYYTATGGSSDWEFIRTVYFYNEFSYEKRTWGVFYFYEYFPRTYPSSFTNTFTRITTSSFKYFESGSQVNTVTTQDRYTSGSLYCYVGARNGSIQADWYFTRKYADPEPTVTLAGYTVNPDTTRSLYSKIYRGLRSQQGNKCIDLIWEP